MLKRLRNNKVAKNAGWLIGAKIIQSLLSVVITVISARFLGPSNYGLISYAASVVSFVTPIALLGINNVAVQELVENPSDEGKVVGSSVIMSIFSASFCFLGIICFSLIANNDSIETTLVVGLYGFMLFFQATELIMYWFQANFINKYYAIVGLIAYSLVAAYKIVLLALKMPIFLFAISNAIDYFLISFVLFIIYKRKGGQRILFDRNVAKRIISKSKHYILPNLMVVVFNQTDHIMLKHMIDNSATGYYQAAVTCAAYSNFVFAAIIDSFRPKIFEDFKVSDLEFEKSVIGLYSIIIYLGILVGALMSVFSTLIITILYGSEYQQSIPALLVVSWFPLFSFIGSVRNIWVLAKGRQRYLWIINLSGAISNIILNIFLIKSLGIVGAAIASLVTQFSTNVLITFVFKPYRRSSILMFKGLDPRHLINLFRSET